MLWILDRNSLSTLFVDLFKVRVYTTRALSQVLIHISLVSFENIDIIEKHADPAMNICLYGSLWSSGIYRKKNSSFQ